MRSLCLQVVFEDGETAEHRGSGSEGTRGQGPDSGSHSREQGPGCSSKGSAVGEAQEPRSRGRRWCAGLCGSPGGRRAPLWGLMTGRRRTPVSTTLSRNGSGKGRAEPGMKASKKEEGHLVGREITKARLEISRGPPRAGTALAREGVSCGAHPPAVRASTARTAGPEAFPGKTPPADGAAPAARPTRLPRRAPPAGAPASSSLVLPGGGASPLWSSPVVYFLTFPNRLSYLWLPPEPGPLRS